MKKEGWAEFFLGRWAEVDMAGSVHLDEAIRPDEAVHLRPASYVTCRHHHRGTLSRALL